MEWLDQGTEKYLTRLATSFPALTSLSLWDVEHHHIPPILSELTRLTALKLHLSQAMEGVKDALPALSSSSITELSIVESYFNGEWKWNLPQLTRVNISRVDEETKTDGDEKQNKRIVWQELGMVLQKSNHLKELNLFNYEPTLAPSPELHCFPLVKLDLTCASSCVSMDATALLRLAKSCPNMTSARISVVSPLNGDEAHHLLLIWPWLTHLDMGWCDWNPVRDECITEEDPPNPEYNEDYRVPYNDTTFVHYPEPKYTHPYLRDLCMVLPTSLAMQWSFPNLECGNFRGNPLAVGLLRRHSPNLFNLIVGPYVNLAYHYPRLNYLNIMVTGLRNILILNWDASVVAWYLVGSASTLRSITWRGKAFWGYHLYRPHSVFGLLLLQRLHSWMFVTCFAC